MHFLNEFNCSKTLKTFFSFFLISILSACGGSGSSGSVTIDTINISPYQISIANASSYQLQAIAIYSDSTSDDVTDQVNWSLLDSNIGNINSTGLVTATLPGSTIITASLQNINATANLTVTSATLNSINVTPGTSSIANGTSTILQANGIFSDLTNQDLTSQVSWQSSNISVAEVSSEGLISSLSTGTVTITASLNGISSSASVTITPATLSSISVTPGNVSIANGTATNMLATGFYSDLTSQDLSSVVSWQSSDTLVAEVSSTGQITSHSTGDATISASFGGRSSSVTVTSTPATLS
ncbi:MAG: Ig-like domain-containing protein, partial [Gammaproteobacteria bacterium]|nr:Ig-like domain-containing protein [Gammaproteobacteria bacterium]